ncbi:hypothetical protein SRHO_G00320940 [Serrasalmus rhombeus]
MCHIHPRTAVPLHPTGTESVSSFAVCLDHAFNRQKHRKLMLRKVMEYQPDKALSLLMKACCAYCGGLTHVKGRAGISVFPQSTLPKSPSISRLSCLARDGCSPGHAPIWQPTAAQPRTGADANTCSFCQVALSEPLTIRSQPWASSGTAEETHFSTGLTSDSGPYCCSPILIQY